MNELLMEKAREIITVFSLIKELANNLMSKYLDEILEQCNQESILAPLIDPTAYMEVNNDFYDEIKEVIRILKEIKDFKLHLYVK